MIGPTIRTMRRARGLSLRALSQRSGLAFSNLSLLECGHRTPTLDTLTRIADALDCDATITLTPRPHD